MAEQFQRSKLYDYAANSNLVLEAERDRRRDEDGKGEVETLNGKLDTIRMGDMVNRERTNDFNQRLEKLKAKRERGGGDMDGDEEENNKNNKKNKDGKSNNNKNIFLQATTKSGGQSFVSATEELDAVSYRPRTRETRSAYEELLSFVQVSLGDQPHDILRGAAEEVLFLLKDDSLRDPDRIREIEKIIPKMSSDKMNKLFNVGKRITDFQVGGGSSGGAGDDDDGGGKMDEEMGVAVVFDDDDDDGPTDLDQERDTDDEEDDEEGGVEAYGSGTLRGDDNDRMDTDQADPDIISVHNIDAHWLQRELSKFYSDANTSSRLAEEVLGVLNGAEERAVENKLVLLLDFDKFDFIKVLLKNRAKLFYCTRLRQAQSDVERKAIESEMEADPSGEGLAILQQYHQKGSAENWTKDRMGEIASKARREARSLTNKGADKNAELVEGFDESLGSSANFVAGLGGKEKILDLDGLTFQQGGHLMTNTHCELPEKSWRAQKKGYEEVHVPAVRPVIPASEKLVDIADLPEWAQPAFAGIRTLNRIQSRTVKTALYSSENMLLCAPTSSGKTNVALLCMLNQIGQYRNEDGSFDLNAFKIVYVAPMKALVQECVQSFGKRLAPYGINVRELSGDQNLSRQQIQDTQVIVTTPEKWDIITRKAGDRTYTQLVRLVIIDEIHLLHDDRGPVLEALVARIIRQVESTQESVRLVGLSATLPNFEDVATFLRVNPEKGLYYFDNSFRPVPLQQQYIGVTERKALKRFQLMNEICYEKVLQHAGKNQILIFTHSRAETAKTAKALRDMALENDTLDAFVPDGSASKEILREEAQAVKNADLKDILPHGFAIHHAGMGRTDRTLVEDLFADKHVQVLVSTATLAWGVNLPCHTVILKGTQMYSPEQCRWVELSPLDIMQMMGRAGRFGLDSEGEGIIITNHSELQFYLSLMNQQLPIESQLIKRLPDSLNAEVVLGNVLSVKEAADWLGYTYLYVRMIRKPSMYGVTVDELERDPSLYQRRLDLAHTAAAILDKHGLVKYDRKSGHLQVTTLGRVASHFYISFDTIRVFNEYMKPTMNEIEIFRLFSMSGEFKHIHVREEEKLELAKLISRAPIPVKEGVEEPQAKVNVLLQAYISRLKLEVIINFKLFSVLFMYKSITNFINFVNLLLFVIKQGFALAADMTFIQQSACRIFRALFEISLKRGWAALSSKILTICKMCEHRIWASQSPLRQFSAIPEVVIRKLEKSSDIVWERYYDLKPQDLGEMVKIPKMGKSLYKYVHMFPKVALSANVQPITRSLLRVDLTITPDFEFDATVHESGIQFWIIVEDLDGEKILYCEPFMLKGAYVGVEHQVNFTVPLTEPLPPQYFIKVVSDRWLHSESVLPVSFRHITLPSKFPPPTELLDLQPLPVKILGRDIASALYNGIENFNSIQTQTFSALYERDNSVLVCAPTGSGKTICAEFALLRLFKESPDAKCVYIAPKDQIATAMFNHWDKTLSQVLDKTVVKLTGDTTVDLRLLEAGQIIVTTALHWDSLSRRWKQRKHIQNIELYIADELHLIGGHDGPTLEIVLSRARYIAAQLERTVRMVGLSSSVANARELGDWLGVSSPYIFNFSPSVRSVPIDIHIFGFETHHPPTRLLSMAKPAYNAIVANSPDKPVIVYVPSRKQSQLTAIDIITWTAAAGLPNRFLRVDPNKIAEVVGSVKDSCLAETIAHGVVFFHAGLATSDYQLVETLFKRKWIGVLVCTYDSCWSVPAPANLVVVMDTVYYEGKEHRYVDSSIFDMLQMVGTASNTVGGHGCKAIVFCQTPKKENLKKLLHEPLPVESHVDQFLHDHICAEVVSRTIENKQDAVDYITWTFYYRRLTQNPNYYNLQGVSSQHVSDHLSELIESVINDLEESKCLTVEDDFDLSPLNIGTISSYYYIQYTTIELFASSVTDKTKIKGILEILSSSSEYASVPIRVGEDNILSKLAKHLPQGLPNDTKFDDAAIKALVLLQTHFSRQPLPSDLTTDVKFILSFSIKLLQAIVDVISSQGWLKPALAAMEVSQMIIQGLWDKDSVLLQLPHVTNEIVQRCKNNNPPVESIFDILDLEDDVRDNLFRLSQEKMSDVAVFCNAYPNIELSYELDIEDNQAAEGEAVTVSVVLKREIDEDEDEETLANIGKVVCPRYGHEKVESWWVVVGDRHRNSMMSIKRVTVGKQAKVQRLFYNHYIIMIIHINSNHIFLFMLLI